MRFKMLCWLSFFWDCGRFWSFGLLCCLAENFHPGRPASPMPGSRRHLFPLHYRYHWKFHRPTDPPAVPLANLVSDAFGKRQSVGRCGGGSITAGTTVCGWVGWCRFWSIITYHRWRGWRWRRDQRLQLINDMHFSVFKEISGAEQG